MTTPLRTRIMLADDHALVRSGIRLILDSEPDLEVVEEAGDGIEAVEIALRGTVDLAILDVSMPGRTGLQVAREITRRRPEIRILLLSMHENEQYLFEALKAGAAGYVLKSAANRDLVDACRGAMLGRPFLYPKALQALTKELLDDARAGGSLPRDVLTAREQEVVKQIAEGLTTDEIAVQLVISPHTVERHRSNALEKLGLRNRVELARYAIRRGLVEP
ncbi:response regulator transcription factor [Patulibacter sp.]|uniref:response regulator n=1 Tax=Patulibacter sp. TaxID=1912859 RepID=UPI00271D1BDF|nr:response regulator transcription factor [Patulibacter sp.]MDO9409045.1 response regulator transcription factor [Patulibacter sp.]